MRDRLIIFKVVKTFAEKNNVKIRKASELRTKIFDAIFEMLIEIQMAEEPAYWEQCSCKTISFHNFHYFCRRRRA